MTFTVEKIPLPALWVVAGRIKALNLEAEKFLGRDLLGRGFETVCEVTLGDLGREPYLKTIGNRIFSLVTVPSSGNEHLVLLVDFTELEKLRDKVFCLSEVLSKVESGIIMSDSIGRVVLYNPAQEHLEGLKSENVIGRYLWEVYNYYSEELSEHREVFRSQKPILNHYRSHIQGGRSQKYLSYSTYPIIRDGKTLSVFSVSKNESNLLEMLSETIELKRRLKDLPQISKKTNGTQYEFKDIKGTSEKLKAVIKDAQKHAMIDGTLLIVGETGVGKEMFAQAVHNISQNNQEKFYAINCAAVPENLLESTLFGTAKGSFTGSIDQRGVLEEVAGGTLFLDELNSMPAAMQTKLLRMLQEKKFQRVGSLESKTVHCRIICAVNENPEKLIKQKKLREDLYYRISRHCLFLPTLRERHEDIIHLANYFIEGYNRDFEKHITELSGELRLLLLDYYWPGNVRELDNVIENMVLQAEPEEKVLNMGHMPHYLKERLLRNPQRPSRPAEYLPDQLRTLETELIVNGLNRHGWNISKTARHLGIIRQSLLYRMNKLSITRETHEWK
ncbi:MAG: hypothetical protein AVO33_10145 [delta proteobacterium ML8_F1]|nr:MAG: hypothetical protein AVO33_10145 [delta proteobacterium ML8_F1]